MGRYLQWRVAVGALLGAACCAAAPLLLSGSLHGRPGEDVAEGPAAVAEAPAPREKAAVRPAVQDRLAAASSAYHFAWDDFRPFDPSKGDGEDVYRWSRRWLDAERDAAAGRDGRAAALKSHLARMTKLEDEVRGYKGRGGEGFVHIRQLVAAKYFRAEAQDWLDAEARE